MLTRPRVHAACNNCASGKDSGHSLDYRQKTSLSTTTFESADRVNVQLLVAVEPPSLLIDSENRNRVRQCTMERTTAGSTETPCEPVESWMSYPVIIHDG